jgi:type II secretion system protein N
VKRFGRLLLWLLGGIVFLAVIGLIGINLFVQSQGTHKRIQQELSQRLGTPLHFRQISLTPWSGLLLKGITIPQEPGKVEGNFLEAESFQLRIQFWSLFSDRLVIRQVSLNRPEVVWPQNAAGKWRLPELPPEKRAAAPASSPVTASTSPTPLPSTSPLATVAPSPPAIASTTNRPEPIAPNDQVLAETPPPITAPEVQRVTLTDGDFIFLDSQGREIAKFLGLDFRSSFRTATEVKGNARVEKVSLRNRFFIEELESPLRFDPVSLVFSNIAARAAGGRISGRFEMRLQEIDSPFTAVVRFHDLQAEQLVTNAGGPAGMIQGRVEGSLEASGKTADSDALAGHGEIVLHDGKLQQYSLLIALGQILKIDELTQLQLQQAEVKYRISPGLITVDQLILRSPNIRLTATGTIKFNGKLHLDSQLALNDKVRRQLFSPVRENFLPLADEPGYAGLDFKISGTVDRPRTDLMNKLVGSNLQDLGGVISSLFGRSKKKKKEEPAAAPTPALSPNDSGTVGAAAPLDDNPTSPGETSSPSPSLSPGENSALATPSPNDMATDASSSPAPSPSP